MTALLQKRPREIDLLVSAGLVTAFQGASRFADARRDFRRALALDPASVDAKLGLARVDLYAEALDASERRVADVLRTHRNNADALALWARIRLARGDPAVAEAIFRQLLARNPRDTEALLGLGDALRAQLRDEEGRSVYALASAIDPTSSDIRKRLDAPVRPRWRLDLDGSYSHLTEGQKPWREGSVRIAYLLTPRTTLSGGVDVHNRFGLLDVLIDGRIDHRWTDALASYLRLGGTPHADFRPEFLVESGGSARLWKGSGVVGPTLATVDVGFARYPKADVKTANPGLQQYFFEDRFWLTAKFISTWSQNTDAETRERQILTGQFKGDTELLTGYLVRADLKATKQLRVFIGYADAPDASDGRVFPERSLFGGAEFALNENISVRVSGSHHKRQNSYDRTMGNVGLTIRF